MQNWLSIHFYPLETADVFLNRAVRPFFEKHIWSEKTARAFFVRFDDEAGREHLRLRFRGEADFLEKLHLDFSTHFANQGEWQEQTYLPEPERFGGEEALQWAEEHFHQSSRVALERLAAEGFSYDDAMSDALRMHVISAHAAGFDSRRITWYFQKLTEQWLPLFFQPAGDAAGWQQDVLEDFEKKLKPQRRQIVDALDQIWKDLQQGKIDHQQPDWLRWLRANELILKGLGENLDRALPSLLHLTNNRLGIRNHDEVFLNFILSRVF